MDVCDRRDIATSGSAEKNSGIAPLRLTRHFLATTVCVVAVVLAAQSWLHSDWLARDLEASSKRHATLVARHIHSRVIGHFERRLKGNDLPAFLNELSEAEFGQLDAIVRSSIAELEVNEVYIFDANHRVAYSTRRENIGRTVSSKGYEAAMKGQANSTLNEEGAESDVDKTHARLSLLEAYVPIVRGGRVVAIFEVYQNASDLKVIAHAGTLHIAQISLAGFALLLLALWILVRRADQELNRRAADLVEANEALAELTRGLEDLAEERARRLAQAETLASVGTLAAGVAHEINNPIATIASCSEGLLRRQQLDEDGLREYLEVIRSESYRVKSITQHLLDFSRRGENQLVATDLLEPIQATLAILQFRAAREGVTLSLAAPDSCAVKGDPTALRQLFLNISINALDACSKGGGVSWDLSEKNRQWLACCRDTGAGAPEGALPHLREPFFTTKPPGVGTGLGLTISQKIMQDHGGRLELTSGEQIGTTVTLTFPCFELVTEEVGP